MGRRTFWRNAMDKTIQAAAHEINVALGEILGAEVVSEYVRGRTVGLHLTRALGYLLIAPEVATEEETGGMLAEVASKATEETREAALAFLGGLPSSPRETITERNGTFGDGFEKAIHSMVEEALRLSGFNMAAHIPSDAVATAYHVLPENGRGFYRRFARSLVAYIQDGLREEV
jgi:hypothetical protein